MLSIVALSALLPGAQAERPPSYARSGKLEIRALTPPKSRPKLWTPAEVRIDLSASYDNPFDPAQIRVDAIVESPSGKKITLPAFFGRDYSRRKEGETEILKAEDEGHWAFRFAPVEPGTYRLSVVAQDRTGSTTSPVLTLATGAPADPPTSGFVGVSARDRRFFETSEGRSFWPVGANVGWAGKGGTYDYDRWIPKYAENGVNLVRLWLSPGWTTFALERREVGFGSFDLANAWRLDRTLDDARGRGVRAQLCLNSYNVLRDKDGSPYWDESFLNRKNGGPLDYPGEFWNAAQAEKEGLAKLRYVVARYAADPSVFAWELWNEADLTRDFDREGANDRVRAWHQRAAQALKGLDPYNHPVTTSFSNTMGVKDIDLLPDMDFLQTHAYVGGDVVNPVVVQQSRKGGWGKPHLLAEIGSGSGGPDPKDARGYEVHDPLWAAIGTASSGSAMSWWWDSATEPRDLYGLYGALAKFVRPIDFPREGFRQTKAVFGYLDSPRTFPLGDVLVPTEAASFSPGGANRPRTLAVTEDGADGAAPSLLHGTGNHPDLHNPVTLDVRLPRRAKFVIGVGGVSGYGGAKLVVRLDGGIVMTREFPDPDGDRDTATLSKYAGGYGFDIPAGRHRIEVENLGKDWFEATYRFEDATVLRQPALDAWAAVGERTTVVWARNSARTFARLMAEGENVGGTIPPTYMKLSGLAAGAYEIVLWDTWKGAPLRSFERRVGLDGVLTAPIPAFRHDLAIRAILKD